MRAGVAGFSPVCENVPTTPGQSPWGTGRLPVCVCVCGCVLGPGVLCAAGFPVGCPSRRSGFGWSGLLGGLWLCLVCLVRRLSLWAPYRCGCFWLWFTKVCQLRWSCWLWCAFDPSGGVIGYVVPGTCPYDSGVGYAAPDPSRLPSGYVSPECSAVLLAMLRQLWSHHGLLLIVM